MTRRDTLPAPRGPETSLAEVDDDTLMARSAAGLDAAFDVLIERHGGRAWRLALRALGDPDEARDLVQTTFAKIHAARGRYHPQGSFPAYLRTVLVRLAKDWRAKGRAEPRAELPPAAAPEEDGPEARVERAQVRRGLGALLLELPRNQRLALVLRYEEDASYAAIAAALETSEKTVENLLRLGRRTLRERLRRRGP